MSRAGVTWPRALPRRGSRTFCSRRNSAVAPTPRFTKPTGRWEGQLTCTQHVHVGLLQDSPRALHILLHWSTHLTWPWFSIHIDNNSSRQTSCRQNCFQVTMSKYNHPVFCLEGSFVLVVQQQCNNTPTGQDVLGQCKKIPLSDQYVLCKKTNNNNNNNPQAMSESVFLWPAFWGAFTFSVPLMLMLVFCT